MSRRDEIVLATKVHASMRGDPMREACPARLAAGSIAEENLGVEHI